MKSNINTYEALSSEINEALMALADDSETYLVSDVHARFSIYVLEASEEQISAIKARLEGLVERVESIEKDGFIHRDLNHPNYKSPIKIAEEKPVYFVDRHINLLNWSLTDRFSSDIPITCFYSFKGGLGRTTALVLTGLVLARQGKKVCLMDFDLEAPGLASIFLNDFPEIKKFRGILDYLVDVSALKSDEYLDLSDYYYTINQQQLVGSAGGEIIIFPAGQSSETEHLYFSKFSKLNAIYQAGQHSAIDDFFKRVSEKVNPDSILVDTRTGLNDWGGLFLSRYAQSAFLFFYGSTQNMFGLETILPELKGKEGLEFYLVNSPVPNGELGKDQKEFFLDRSYSLFTDLFYEENDTPYLKDETAPHVPIEVPYNDLAILLDSTEKLKGLIEEGNGKNPYVKMASLIWQNPASDVIKEENTDVSAKIGLLKCFEQVSPPSAASEYEFDSLEKLTANFYPRKDYKFIFDPQKFLILGEKGTGKTALYAVLSEPAYARELAKYCGVSSHELDQTEWIKGLDKTGNFPQPSAFEAVGKMEKTAQRRFWKNLLLHQLKSETVDGWSEFIQTAEKSSEIALDDELATIHQSFQSQGEVKTLVYDYLDVLIDETIRGKLISALLEVWREIQNRYAHIRCKIFLRKDIFEREVSDLTDKVKLDNHKAEIKWEYDQLLNIVWKRVWHEAKVNSFMESFQQTIAIEKSDNKEFLGYLPLATEHENRAIMKNLVGEYMGGNNKAFPYNWVIYHVSDTHKNLHPRSLLILFSEAARQQIEKEDFLSNSVIAPKYLELANKKVSDARLNDIKEEYPQLKRIFEKLSDYIQQFPVEESKLDNALENLLMQEKEITLERTEIKRKLESIGVLYEYKFKKKDDEKKYHIPDLYLIGMNLKRKGPGAHKALFSKK